MPTLSQHSSRLQHCTLHLYLVSTLTFVLLQSLIPSSPGPCLTHSSNLTPIPVSSLPTFKCPISPPSCTLILPTHPNPIISALFFLEYLALSYCPFPLPGLVIVYYSLYPAVSINPSLPPFPIPSFHLCFGPLSLPGPTYITVVLISLCPLTLCRY